MTQIDDIGMWPAVGPSEPTCVISYTKVNTVLDAAKRVQAVFEKLGIDFVTQKAVLEIVRTAIDATQQSILQTPLA